VANAENALLIERMSPVHIAVGGQPVALWDDPNLEETIEKLEWAYQHPGELRAIGRRAGEDLAAFTWERAAGEFHAILTGSGGRAPALP
ncbi:MAG: hypothetical protein ACYDAG_19115, partial [Chloroflexota bacterium]